MKIRFDASRLIAAGAIALLLGCSESNFSGSGSSQGAKSSDKTASSPPPASSVPPSTNCVDGQKVTLEFEKTIQDCIDQGKLYHFDSKVCTSMPPARFECTFKNLIDAMADLNLSSSKLSSASTDGSLLVGCGQSSDGKTIVAQWFKPPTDSKIDCKYSASGGRITTGCYKNYGSGKMPSLNKNDKDEERRFVLACMNGEEFD